MLTRRELFETSLKSVVALSVLGPDAFSKSTDGGSGILVDGASYSRFNDAPYYIGNRLWRAPVLVADAVNGNNRVYSSEIVKKILDDIPFSTRVICGGFRPEGETTMDLRDVNFVVTGWQLRGKVLEAVIDPLLTDTGEALARQLSMCPHELRFRPFGQASVSVDTIVCREIENPDGSFSIGPIVNRVCRVSNDYRLNGIHVMSVNDATPLVKT